MSGWGWGWMLFGTLFWAAIVGLVLWAVLRGPRSDLTRVDPEGILAQRFARGEISSEEFAERREALRES
ncbi:MAG: SHOCT domain-containing protein [Acidimicrobiia bacterium]|nr:SHOCT domain-containing protein [Acidimicrobiales bacterium]NNL98822.1 SHOCT domain-containing protein [Acidimicrobiia bacterium]